MSLCALVAGFIVKALERRVGTFQVSDSGALGAG
jgi:hypothetical protein